MSAYDFKILDQLTRIADALEKISDKIYSEGSNTAFETHKELIKTCVKSCENCDFAIPRGGPFSPCDNCIDYNHFQKTL